MFGDVIRFVKTKRKLKTESSLVALGPFSSTWAPFFLFFFLVHGLFARSKEINRLPFIDR